MSSPIDDSAIAFRSRRKEVMDGLLDLMKRAVKAESGDVLVWAKAYAALARVDAFNNDAVRR